jgi:hypothetical protein
MTIKLDHIAILTTSLEKCIDQLPVGFSPQEIEIQPAEGTREQYVSTLSADGPALLLLEPIQPGPYQTALEKRGPGLHHLGCTTDSLDEAVAHFSTTGLLLHPVSLKSYTRDTVWLCRPGVPYLIELYRVPSEIKQPEVEVLIELPRADSACEQCNQHVPGVVVRASDGSVVKVSIDARSVSIRP